MWLPGFVFALVVLRPMSRWTGDGWQRTVGATVASTVKRVAEGKHVPLEEIQAAYLAYNGKPMPCGKWSHSFQ
jgi:hypothetical protein